jgi:hypothetical protein
VERVWDEALAANGAGAPSAAEMMCRTILMHVAVDKAGAPPGEGFKFYVERLGEAGYVAKGLEARVSSIKDRGNAAVHELPGSTAAQALQTIKVTEHLLRSIYEFADEEENDEPEAPTE